MELIDAIQSLELIYRAGIFFGLLFAAIMISIKPIGTFCDMFDRRVAVVLENAIGLVVLVSVLVVIIAILRFGVQIIFGV